MKSRLLFPCLALFGLTLLAGQASDPAALIAPKPLFRDPVYDGAADPVVVWNASQARWWMFYTNRRANVPWLSGVAWVHGCKIGIAESADGANWTYVGTAEIDLPADIGGTEPTLWAPDIVTAEQVKTAMAASPNGLSHQGAGGATADASHMFLTVVPGVFENCSTRAASSTSPAPTCGTGNMRPHSRSPRTV
jgi:hypothetical protein